MPTAIPGKRASRFARVFLLFFGLPFVAGGLFGFYAMLKAIDKADAAFKDIALPAIFGLVFCGAGVLMWSGAIFGPKKVAEAEQRQAAAPGQPWLWREDWAQGRSAGSAKKQQWGLWIFAIFWNLVSAPVLFIVPAEIPENPAAAVALLFPVVGVGMLVWATRASLRARRFGATSLELAVLPVVPGGRLSGTIRARFPVAPAQGVKLQLTCLRRSFSGTGKDRDTREEIVWREERELAVNDVMVAGGEASIPVRFALPADTLETSATSDGEAGIFWCVTAEAALEGIDYQDDFEIPVYRHGAAPAESAAPGEPVFASDRTSGRLGSAAVPLDELARAGITVTAAPEGIEYRFAAGRNVGFAGGLLVFAAIWTGSVVFMYKVGAPWLFTGIFGLFDLLFLLMVMDQLFGVTRLAVSNGAIVSVYTMLGLGRRTTIPFENITKIDLHINMQSSGRRGTPYYALRATFINGRTRVLASGVKDKRQAEWLAAELRRAIGLKAA